MLALAEEGISIDYFTLREELRRRDKEELAGGMAYIASELRREAELRANSEYLDRADRWHKAHFPSILQYGSLLPLPINRYM
jgi:hypothetical protein